MVTAPGPESASEYPRFSCPPTEVEQGGGGVFTSKQKETTKKLAPVSLLVVVVGDQL